MRSLVTAALVMTLAIEASALPNARKYIFTGWDFGTVLLDELPLSADLFKGAAADGAIVYAAFNDVNGKFRRWNEPMSADTFTDAELDRFVPGVREFREKSGLVHSFVTSWDSTRKRLDWRDDAAWRHGAENLAVLARFSKKCGFVGLAADFEDYHNSRQFTLAAGDPDYETACRLARRRGREFFEAAFREFPEMTVIIYHFVSANWRYKPERTPDPAEAARAEGDLQPSYFNGLLDALPPTAKLVDGNEDAGYHGEAEKRDFAVQTAYQLVGVMPLIAPENRVKYRMQVGVGFGQYVDSYHRTDEKSSWYKGPKGGSRLEHFRENLAGATQAAEEYVWFWNERIPYVKWRKASRGKWFKGCLEETFPGFNDMLWSVKDPIGAVKRHLDAPGAVNLADPATASAWQSENTNFVRGVISTVDFEGRRAHRFEGVGNGSVDYRVEGLKAGEKYALCVEGKSLRGLSAGCHWQKGRSWRWKLGGTACLWEAPGADGWRKGYALVTVPEGADALAFQLGVHQPKGETAHYANVRIVKVK